jgi:hypothetical protein
MNSYTAVIRLFERQIRDLRRDQDERCPFRGQVEGIGVAPRFRVVDSEGVVMREGTFAGKA